MSGEGIVRPGTKEETPAGPDGDIVCGGHPHMLDPSIGERLCVGTVGRTGTVAVAAATPMGTIPGERWENRLLIPTS